MKRKTKTPKALKKGKTSVTPDAPKSQKKQKTKHANKKQKLNDESKIVTDSTNKQHEKNALADGEIRVFFHPGKLISSELIQKMFQECQYVKFLNHSFLIKYDSKVASKKLKELSKVEIEGIPLRVYGKTQNSSLKRAFRLSKKVDVEKVKEFYEPKSLEVLLKHTGTPSNLYILTFETEEKANAASQKKFDLGDDKSLQLFPFYENSKSVTKPYEEIKQVNSENQTQKAKAKQPKTKKNKQVKRKAEEEEEEEEAESINMDDDDDDGYKE